MFITTPVSLGLPKLKEIMAKSEKGLFPVGANSFWHGGFHIATGQSVRAVMDGQIVAYRFDTTYETHKELPYSSGFILTKHEYTTPNKANIVFWCLYMHLESPKKFTEEQKKQSLPFFPKKYYCLKKLTLRDEPGKEGKALGSFSKDSEIFLRDPELSFSNEYEALKNGTYTVKNDKDKDIQVVVDDDHPGYVMFSSEYILAKEDPAGLTYDTVIESKDGIPIKVGQILGFPGPYVNEKQLIHFEIIVDNVNFLDNPAKDTGVDMWLRVAPNAAIHNFSKILETLDADADVILNSTESNSAALDKAYGKNYRPIKSAAGNEGFAPKDALKYDRKDTAGAVHYKIKSRTPLYSYLPPKPLKDLFVKSTTTNADVLFVEPSKSDQVEDSAGTKWFEVYYNEGKSKGWVQEKDSKISAASLYDWPNWTKIIETNDADPNRVGFSTDAFCDAKKLLEWLDKDNENKGTVEESEIKSGYSDNYLKTMLSRLICCHPSEWKSKSDDDKKKWARLKKAPFNLSDEAYAATMKMVNKLQWRDEIKELKLPDANAVFHVHPIGFLESLDALDRSFNETSKANLMKLVAKIESGNKYGACNKDAEYSGGIVMEYTGLVHIGLSWGFVQFTQDGGSLGKVLRKAYTKDKAKFEEVFGNNSSTLVEVLERQGSGIDIWAKLDRPKAGAEIKVGQVVKNILIEVTINLEVKKPTDPKTETKTIWVSSASKTEIQGKTESGTSTTIDVTKVAKVLIKEIRGPRVQKIAIEKKADGTDGELQDIWEGTWVERFKKAGDLELFQEAQREVSDEVYMRPALRVCKEYNLRSEKTMTFAFDRYVNQGPGGGASLLKAATNGGTAISPLGEYDFLNELPAIIKKKVAGSSQSLALTRLKMIMAEKGLSITNYSTKGF